MKNEVYIFLNNHFFFNNIFKILFSKYCLIYLYEWNEKNNSYKINNSYLFFGLKQKCSSSELLFTSSEQQQMTEVKTEVENGSDLENKVTYLRSV